jgi:hypothetical protein
VLEKDLERNTPSTSHRLTNGCSPIQSQHLKSRKSPKALVVDEHDYALMGERVPAQCRLRRTEALAEFALRHFTRHGRSTRNSSPPCGVPLPTRTDSSTGGLTSPDTCGIEALAAVAAAFGVRRHAVTLIAGASSRTKIVDVAGADQAVLDRLLRL